MAESFKKGDRVEWNTSGGKTQGEVKKKLTKPIDIKSQHIKASSEEPKYLVESEKSGKEAAHKPESLEKIED